MAIVTLEGVTKRFGEVVAVHKFSLESGDGEFVVLVGPSGCGKSTTLRMLAGLEELSEGSIRIGGREVQNVPSKNRDIAMVFQSYALYPHMNVFSNMSFGLRMRKVPKPEIRERVVDAARVLGIEHLLERKPRELSGGQRQRVALGRAIVREPQVFLMDEPLSNLDAKLRVDMRAEIMKLHQRLGVTSFYVTHDQVEAMTMGERIVVMRDGWVQQIGTPLQLYDTPVNRFVAGFIGNPSMNFLRMQLSDAGDVLTRAGCRIDVPPSLATAVQPHRGRDVWLGIRPEHLVAASGEGPGIIPTRVELIEPLGSSTEMQVDFDGDVMTAKLDRQTHAQLGQPLQLRVPTEHLHLFDVESEIRLQQEPA